MWRHVDLVRPDVSKEHVASTFGVQKSASEQADSYPLTLFLAHRFSTLEMEVARSSKTYILTRPTRRNIPEDCILYSHRCEGLKSYIILLVYEI
jgi:hypothetical protein